MPKKSQMAAAPMVSENVAGIALHDLRDDVLLARVADELAAEHLLHQHPVLHVERLVEAPLCRMFSISWGVAFLPADPLPPIAVRARR
jgi:hypothetical protein